MAITFGTGSVGSGSSTGSQSVTVTMTDDVLPGNAVSARWVVFEVSTKFFATVGPDDFTINDPDISFSPTKVNYLGQNLGLATEGALIPTAGTISGDWIRAVGAYPMIVISPMAAGDIITLDFTAKTTRTLQWLHVNARTCVGLNAIGDQVFSGIFYGHVFGTANSAGTLYIPGNSNFPSLPPTFLEDWQLYTTAATNLDSQNMQAQIVAPDAVVADFFDRHIAPGDGITGFAVYSFTGLPSTAMVYQWNSVPQRNTYGMLQMVEGPGLGGVTSFDDVFFPQ